MTGASTPERICIRRIEELDRGKTRRKIALVTGGSSGMGLATAQRFAEEGAYVFITGRWQADLDAAAKQIGPNVAALRGDVADLGDLDRLYAVMK